MKQELIHNNEKKTAAVYRKSLLDGSAVYDVHVCGSDETVFDGNPSMAILKCAGCTQAQQLAEVIDELTC